MLAYTNTESTQTHKHTDTQTDKRRPITQRWVSGPLNSLASRQQVHLTEWRLLFTRLGVTFFLAKSAASQRVRWPRPYAGWLSFIEKSFLCARYLPASQQGLGFTLDFPVLPEHGCYIYPSPLSWKCSLSPVKGSWTSPQMICPMSEPPSGQRESIQDKATHKKGSLLLTRVRAPAASNAVVRGQRALSPRC